MFVVIIKLHSLQPASISSAMCGLCIPVKDVNILNKVVLVVWVDNRESLRAGGGGGGGGLISGSLRYTHSKTVR